MKPALQNGFHIMLKFLFMPGKLALYPLLLVLSLPVQAAPLDQMIDIKHRENSEGRLTQQRVEEMDDRKQHLIERYRQLALELDQVERSNQSLEIMVAGQTKMQDEFAAQVAQIDTTQRHITPMMIDMVDALEQFVRLDLPFLPEERSLRTSALRQILEDPTVNQSTRYTRILDAYQIESDYGRSLETYQEKVTLEDGVRIVNVLRIGRIGLYYLSLDGTQAGYWERKAQQWRPLPTSSLSSLKKGILIAQKKATPDLLNLPVTVME